jgi:Resolvase, N terminal domain/Recombinase/Recombinase zinc beta ribbon domain
MGASYTAAGGIGVEPGSPLVRAALYCRLSRRGGRSVERQEQDGRRIAAEKGWEVVAVYREWASASPYARKARQEWDRLLAAVEAGEFDAVIVWMEDRTARDVIQAGAFVQACRKAGLMRLVLPSYEYDLTDRSTATASMAKWSTPSGRPSRSASAASAHLEEAENGRRHSGGKRAFGERGRRRIEDEDGNPRTVPIVSEAQAEAERELIREAARRILAGDSLRGICLDWNEAGHESPRGERWTTQTLRRLLLQPRLVGMRQHNGQLYEGSFPAILERKTWQAVRAILTDPARMTTAVGGTPRHLLTGLIFCGVCEAKLRTTRYGLDRVLYYRCPSRSDGGRNCVARKVEDLGFSYLNRGDGGVVEILHTGELPFNAKIEGAIVGVDGPPRRIQTPLWDDPVGYRWPFVIAGPAFALGVLGLVWLPEGLSMALSSLGLGVLALWTGLERWNKDKRRIPQPLRDALGPPKT